MALHFDTFRVIDVKNPSKHCTELCFSDGNNANLKSTSLILFEQQIKYVITEEFDSYKRTKIFVRDDDDPIIVDFHPEEYQLYEALFLSLYNKNI